jgi:hypothetical protein
VPARRAVFGTNAVKSTKYEWYTFLPINLFEQLAPWIKFANFYFLCMYVRLPASDAAALVLL